jgi:copper chaperone
MTEQGATMSTTATYTVTGMTCGHCVNAVTSELSGIDGVTDVHVDLDTGRATVTSAAPLDRDTVAAAVDEAGYQLIP